jgi:hypothetical protein
MGVGVPPLLVACPVWQALQCITLVRLSVKSCNWMWAPSLHWGVRFQPQCGTCCWLLACM